MSPRSIGILALLLVATTSACAGDDDAIEADVSGDTSSIASGGGRENRKVCIPKL